MKAFIYLTGQRAKVSRWGTRCHKTLTYEWELPDITMTAFTKLRQDLGTHVMSGIAEPLWVGKRDIDGEQVNVAHLTLKKPVMRGTVVMVNTAVKRALRGG